MNRETIAAIVAAQRIAQGLPPHIDDPVALARIANLLKMPRGPLGVRASKVRRGKNDTPVTAVRCV